MGVVYLPVSYQCSSGSTGDLVAGWGWDVPRTTREGQAPPMLHMVVQWSLGGERETGVRVEVNSYGVLFVSKLKDSGEGG